MIITTDKKYLIERCQQRGYLLEEIMPCVIAQDGDQWIIDTEHPLYPKKRPVVILFGPTENGADSINTIS